PLANGFSDEGFLYRRGRDPRPGGDSPGDQSGRLHFDRRALWVRQIDAALDPGAARFSDRGELSVERQAGPGAVAERARPDTQPQNRLHLLELQSDWRPDRLRKRGVAADLPRDEFGRTQKARQRRPGEGRDGAPRQTPAVAALRRSAAARGRRARG